MKNLISVLLLSVLISSNAFGVCLGPDRYANLEESFAAPDFFDGATGLTNNTYPLGHVLNIDQSHPETIAWHKAFILKHGIEPDGGAFKQALCTFIVDPAINDYPIRSERKYVWIALPYATSFEEKDLRPSYSEK